MSRKLLLAGAIVVAALGSGCSIVAPQYSSSMQNVQKLKDAGNTPAKVGEFGSRQAPENANPISLRGSSLVSPYASSYANYLGEAIKQELTLAGRLTSNADIEVSGVLLKNDINVSGFSVGYGDIEARFVVKKGGRVTYDQTKSAHTEWESAFAGPIAIPRGRDEYPRLVQQLLAVLYTDKTFLEALQ